MVILNGVFSEFVDREQEWIEILFVGVTFIPTLSSVSSENMVSSSLDQSECRPLSITQLVELGSCKSMSTRLVESINFVCFQYSNEEFINKLFLRLIFKDGRIVE